jgi:hypothetical protein
VILYAVSVPRLVDFPNFPLVLTLTEFPFTLQIKAIEELKEKAKRGERLEATQVKKMEGEADIRKELAALSAQLESASM